MGLPQQLRSAPSDIPLPSNDNIPATTVRPFEAARGLGGAGRQKGGCSEPCIALVSCRGTPTLEEEEPTPYEDWPA